MLRTERLPPIPVKAAINDFPLHWQQLQSDVAATLQMSTKLIEESRQLLNRADALLLTIQIPADLNLGEPTTLTQDQVTGTDPAPSLTDQAARPSGCA